MPKPILLLARSLTPGGSERQMTEIARSLDPSTWEVHVGCFHDDGPRADELRQAGIPIVCFPVRSFASASVVHGGRMLGRYLRTHGIVLMHAFDVPMIIFGTLFGRLYRCPVVLSSARAYRILSLPRERFMLRVTDSLVDGIVVNCEALRRHLTKDELVPAERIHLCYNGVNTAGLFRRHPPHPRPLATAGLVIGSVCVLRPEKGLHLLLEAFAEVRSITSDLMLVLVGSGPMMEPLQEQAVRLKVQDNVWFEPATHNVAEWFSLMDIFVLPSLTEALSNSLMEAMLCGCAVIASDVGGNPELVIDGRTGLLFDPQSAASLAGCLQRLISDDTQRARLAAEGERFIREQFTLSRSTRRMEEIYHSQLTKRDVCQVPKLPGA